MITLDLQNDFTFNTTDGTELSGTFRDLNIKEKAKFEKQAQKNIKLATKVNKLFKKIKRNESRIAHFESSHDYEKSDELITKNEKLSTEIEEIGENNDANALSNEMLQGRFNLCLGGKDRETIIKIAEEIGYKPVFDVIQKAIEEGKRKS